MIAHTATTPASLATGCDVGGSASAPDPASPPYPSVPSPLRPSAPSSFDLPGADFPTVPAHLHNRILSELCHPGSSLISVARNNNVDLAVLAMWLTEPETREKMLAIEKGGYAHTRMAASVTLASTVNVLHTIIEDYTQARAHAKYLLTQERLAPAASRHDPLPPSPYHAHPDRSFLPGEAILADTSLKAQRLELRRAEGVRRASLHLYRLSRIVPVDDSKLACATGCLSTSANISNTSPAYRTASVSERVTASDRTASVSEPVTASERSANVSERTSSSGSSLPSQPVHPAGALQDLPLAAGLKPDANSPSALKADAHSRVACLHEVQACSANLSASATTGDSDGSSRAAMPPDARIPWRRTSSSPSPLIPSAPSPPSPVPRPPRAA